MDYLMLVNKFEPIPDGYEYRLRLKEVRGKLFERQTAAALSELLNSAQNDGQQLQVVSGYRSSEYQQMLWEKEISKEMASGLDYAQAVKKVGLTLALPGSSEHATGLAVDFAQFGKNDVDYSFTGSEEAIWLDRNAHKHGFILRYPRLKEHITGFSFEPWHYRYVGVGSARIIKENGICLEEFLDFYQDKYLDSTKQGI